MTTAAGHPSLRIALLLDAHGSPRWARDLVECLRSEEGLHLVLAIRKLNPPPAHRVPWLFRLWQALDRRLFPLSPDALGLVNLDSALGDLPRLDVHAIPDKGRDGIADTDRATIEAHRPDVLLKLGFGELSDTILTVAPLGVWALDPGSLAGEPAPPPGLWEFLLRRPTTSSTLFRLGEAPGGAQVLYRSWTSTHKFSFRRHQNALAWKGLAFFLRALQRARGTAPSEGSGEEAHPPTFSTSLRLPLPGAGALLFRLGGILAHLLARQAGKFFRTEQWMLLYAWGGPEGPETRLSRYRKLVSPRHQFWADPILVEHDGKAVLFLEENENRLGKAHLSVLAFDGEGRPQLPPQKILEKPTHLSYPFVFQDGGEWYLIPESKSTGTVELYRATRFPDRWEFVMNLLEGVAAVDATIWKHEGRYWMFVNLAERPGVSTWDELFLFSASTLLTRDWVPHPLNPIVSDVRRARPAGPIFRHGDRWFRPSQDCSGDYGMAVVFNRIDQITPERYAETPLGRLDAEWDPAVLRTHTYCRTGRLTVLDGLQRRWRWTTDRPVETE